MSIQFKKSVLLLAATGVFSLGLTGCGDDAKSDVKVIKVGVVGEYNVQWDTVKPRRRQTPRGTRQILALRDPEPRLVRQGN